MIVAAGRDDEGSILAAFASSVTVFIVLVSLALAGHGAWFTNALSIPSDLAPRGLVASCYGINALGGGLGGIVSTEITGIVVDRFHSFTSIFVAAGIMPVLATTTWVVLGGARHPWQSHRQSR